MAFKSPIGNIATVSKIKCVIFMGVYFILVLKIVYLYQHFQQ